MFAARRFAEQDPRGFLGKFADSAVLDEVQRVPSLLSYVQDLVDRMGAILMRSRVAAEEGVVPPGARADRREVAFRSAHVSVI